MTPPQPVNPNDLVSRFILDPKDYNHGGMLNLGIGFVFPSDGGCCESVNCNRILGNDPIRIHALGFAKQGLDKKGRIQNYKGYVEAKVEKIISIISGTHTFSVFHEPSEGPSHCHIKMNYPERNKQYRTTAISRLVGAFSDIIPAPRS